jgi:hypothetical protein
MVVHCYLRNMLNFLIGYAIWGSLRLLNYNVVYENVIQVIKYSQCCTVLIQQNRLQNSAPNLIIVKITLYLYFRITNT